MAPALGQASTVGHMLELINQDRAQHGVGPVALNAGLDGIAQSQAQAMAAAHRIFQNPAFPGNVPNANAAGENVGVGPDVDSVHAAFVASPEHQVILVDPAYRYVGIGLASSSLGLMVAEEFVDQASGGSLAPPPPPPPPPPPAPRAPPPLVPVSIPQPAVAPPKLAPVAPVAAPAAPAPAVPAPEATPSPAPQPPPPPPPTFDVALYARMLQWEQWQTG